ncbi:hypothetical protein CCR75_006451 [Bremia lactucae]|uniref:RWP-RK domain-containing protein n=1 Tax=Bremia lactucae TaxID=4779 RepID=A0A976FNF7_BRELC|nr:hypothetical protein CCR75_006451 [Bremia lactucae]
MPSFSMCATSSTFNVEHPLHTPSASPFHPSFTLSPSTLTASPSQLTSPTISYSRARTAPAVSPIKRTRKSRVVYDFTTEEMARYFHMSQREAAQQLGVATVTIKRNCRRLGIVWPYRLMKSKKHAINWAAISREDAERIRQERALERAKAGRSPSSRKYCQPSNSSDDEVAANVMAMLSHTKNSRFELTEAGRAFARLPIDSQVGFH